MTSYPVCNKAPLYRKPCISQIKSYIGTLSGSHGRSFRIRHVESREAPPGGGLTTTSYPVGNKTSFSRKPCMVAKKLHHLEVTIALSESVMKTCVQLSLAEDWR